MPDDLSLKDTSPNVTAKRAGIGNHVPDTMRAWVLGDPGEMKLTQKPVPTPGRAEVLVRVDAVAICATDLEILEYGTPR